MIKVIFDSIVKEPLFSEKHRDSWIFKNSDITFEEVEKAPTINEITLELQAIFNLYHVTSYNKQFDLGFLKNRNFKIIKELPCIMLTATNYVKIESSVKEQPDDYKWPKVEEAWNFFFPHNNYKEVHRAVDDAFHEAKILFKMYKLGYFQFFQ